MAMTIGKLNTSAVLLIAISFQTPINGQDHPNRMQEEESEFLAVFLQCNRSHSTGSGPAKKAQDKKSVESRLEVGQKVPDFLVTNLDGTKCKLSEIQ